MMLDVMCRVAALGTTKGAGAWFRRPLAGERAVGEQSLNAEWDLNSYRRTNRYGVATSEEIESDHGLSAKIRDATISLSGGGVSSTKTNVGFVPLINVRFLWKASSSVGVLVEADALAAPQGRAEDVLAAVVLHLTDRTTIRAGYRILEGGADNETVYNFSLFHYALLGVGITL
ncbi:MAG: hypothetical protein MUE68_04155 [Bacteroidetes bacterium]|jgi:hypothetical protein|nr:hypothetical protein [Bacteroidota bacterium]